MTSSSKADPREGAPHPWLYFALAQLLSIPFYWGVLTPIQGSLSMVGQRSWRSSSRRRRWRRS
jgi:hypothetical protein